MGRLVFIILAQKKYIFCNGVTFLGKHFLCNFDIKNPGYISVQKLKKNFYSEQKII